MKGKYSGYSYQTVKGNTLTAKGYSTENQKGRYTMECSVCSVDEELFPYGSIVTSGDSVRGHKCVCGCGTTYRWSEGQYLIRVRRRCKEEGYTFSGFVEDYKDYNTKLDLYNPSTGNSWDTTNIQSFLLNNVKDPVISMNKTIESCIKPDQYFIDKFVGTGKFLEGTVFERVGKNRWEYTCPRCSFDELVLGGVCSGVFDAFQGHLSAGKLSCRCGRHKSTPEQITFLIEKKLAEIGGIFIRWCGKNRSKRHGKFEWVCSKGHHNKSPVTYFLLRGNCKTCCANGFKNHLPAFLYLVRWESEDKRYSCIKYGITNISTSSRVTRQNKKTKLKPTLLYEFYHEKGTVVEACEKAFKSEIGSHFCDREVLPRGFSETVEDTEDNVIKLLSVIAEFGLHSTSSK